MSVIFPPAILGPEVAAPTLWTPGIFGLFLLESPHVHKILRFGRGGGGLGFFFETGGVEVPILFFLGVGIFPTVSIPWPSNPCFFLGGGGKARETPKNARVFLFAEPLKSPEKQRTTHKKKARKIGGSGNLGGNHGLDLRKDNKTCKAIF